MFKFIRRYQKWLLVVFCAVLMVAFLIQPVMSIFFPDPSKRTLGTLASGGKVTEKDKADAVYTLSLLRQMGFSGIGLYPQEDSEADAGLAWVLMVRGGEAAGLDASDSEAFTALSMVQSEITDIDSLDAFAAEKNITRAQLLDTARQYLIAEQYRQLVLGLSYEPREGYSGSPGLARMRMEGEARQRANAMAQQQLSLYAQIYQGNIPPQVQQQIILEAQSSILNRVLGHPRISEDALRYAVQRQRAELSGELVVFDAEPATLPPTDEAMRQLFEDYRDVFAGRGETYGFGYRVPAKVRLEAVRIPLDQALAAARDEVTEADVRRYYDRHARHYAEWTPRDQQPEDDADPTDPETGEGTTPEGGETPGDDAAPGAGETPETPEGTVGEDESDADPADGGNSQAPESTDGTQPAEPDAAEPGNTDDAEAGADTNAGSDADNGTPSIDNRVRIDFKLRREIRDALVLQRAREIQFEIARDIHRLLADDARVLDEEAGFKVVPDGYTPRALAEIAERIQQDYGVTLEVIADDGAWVELPELTRSLRFVSGMVQTLPSRTVYSATGSAGVASAPLAGRLGLNSAFVIDETGQQRATLEQLAAATRELLPEGTAAQLPNQPQVGLALAQTLSDATGSLYIARITGAQRDRPAESLAEVREAVERDAKLKAGYDTLLAREEALLQQARDNTIHDLAGDNEVIELNGFTRGRPPSVPGIAPQNLRPLVDEAFALAERLREAGGVDAAVSADRVIAVRFPYERKLAIFLLDRDRPVSRRDYTEMLDPDRGDNITLIAALHTTPEDQTYLESMQQALSLDALVRQTGFTYAEGEGPEGDDGASDGSGDQ